MRVRTHRPGFTLLEVLLAAAIGVLLMAGLYTALNLTLSHAQAGRDKVEQATIARSLFNRMSIDVLTELAPYQSPPAGSGGGGMGGGGGMAGAGGGSGAGASGSSGQGGSSSAQSSSSSVSGSNVTGLGGTFQFNQGVQGDNGTLVLYVSRLPSELDPSWNGDDVPVVSDLRRITYWLSSGGLSRQEIKIATSDDDAVSGLPTDLPDDPSLVLAPEVQSLTFQYFDGTNWQDTWDGTQTPASGGNNAQGPPLAIAITMELALPGSSEGGTAKRKTFRHVIAIPTANGTTIQNSSSSGSSTTSSSSGQ
jgi:prepilin-type N-terminal cleavage/methylation domain-containing protein